MSFISENLRPDDELEESSASQSPRCFTNPSEKRNPFFGGYAL